jgi:hypothetical protein
LLSGTGDHIDPTAHPDHECVTRTTNSLLKDSTLKPPRLVDQHLTLPNSLPSSRAWSSSHYPLKTRRCIRVSGRLRAVTTFASSSRRARTTAAGVAIFTRRSG